ncbi:MAG TPA: DUF308 domain-containing protein [Actinocrinis sp.]|nr:DUF308 domain-containing protein [Actinocrinis sp.]
MDDERRDYLTGPLERLARGAWQAVLLLGVLSLLLGIGVLVWPKATLAVVGALFGAYLVISGILQLVAAFGTHAAAPMRVLGFVSGTITLLLGLFCFRGALESILLLALWIGIAWLFRGLAQIAAAASDPLMPARNWQILAGIVSAVAGVVLMVAPLHSIVRLVIAPKIVGTGRRLLDGLPAITLASIRSEVSPSGYLMVDYRVVR